jgi:hypothetical protein
MGRLSENINSAGSGGTGSGYARVDISDVVQELEKLASRLTKQELKKATRKSVAVFVKTAKQMTPVGKVTHHRYINGRKVASYYPGNLRRSIGILKLRDKNLTFIGHRLAGKGETQGVFRGNKHDGYYGAIVEYHQQAHIYPAWEATRAQVYENLAQEVKRILQT